MMERMCLEPALRGEFFGQDEGGGHRITPTLRVFSISGALHARPGLHLGRRVALQLSPRHRLKRLTLTPDQETQRCAFILAKKLKSRSTSRAHPLEGVTP